MKEAAGLNNQFYGWSEIERDNKLRELCGIINRYAKIVTWSVIDLEAHAQIWAKHLVKPNSEPYFWPFQNTILATCFTLWDAGVREKFEAIFDHQLIFGPRAKAWYQTVREIGFLREPEAASILPIDPLFRDDKNFLPLQAADLYAWTIRKSTNDPCYEGFHWLLDELRDVKTTDYSQYYDAQRMVSVIEQTYRFIEEKAVPEALIEKMRAQRRERGKS